ncbi:MAG: DUF1573 domain-containing protein [Flavobacteriales bacterium]|nr:DUF1573 domain-containing protein [Flavobacteriales bacterium]
MMRTTSFLFMIAVLFVGCRLTDHSENEGVTTDDLTFPVSGYEKVDAADLPKIVFDRTEVEMGRITQGQRVEEQFTFTNEGGSPLVITDVRSTCGCTVGKDWPKGAIPPGGTGSITVTFDSEGREGMQHKTVTVLANSSPPSTVLTLTGDVVGPKPTN